MAASEGNLRDSFHEWKNLKTVNLAGTSITNGTVLTIATSSPSITSLNLSECRDLTPNCVSSIALLHALKTLTLRRLSALTSDSSVYRLIASGCPSLTDLDLTLSQPTDAIGDAFAKKLALSRINLSSSNVSPAAVSAIVTPALTSLDLANATAASDQLLKSLGVASVRNLTEISLVGSINVTDTGLRWLSETSTGLRTLLISKCQGITDVGIDYITGSCQELRKLSVAETRLTARSMDYLSRLHWLEYLDLSDCILISKLSPLLTSCPRLQTLLLSGLEYLADAAIESISSLPFLVHLDITRCRRLTDLTLTRLVKCGSLSRLDLGMNKISDPAVARLTSARLGLKIRSIELAPSPKPPTVQPRRTSAQKSLMNDLREIQREPLELVTALPLDGDLFTWHANMVGPPGTPYAGGIWHFELKFPATYPNDSPSGALFTPLPHPHVIGGKICLDILADYQSYFREVHSPDKTIGWSSAYSVQTLLLQLQSMSFHLACCLFFC
jgi:ubiquitin-protein ligase